MRELAEDGVEDELDPACVKLFGRTRDFARVTIGTIIAELAGHLKKGMWG